MSSIFTKIINGEIPAYKIAEDEKHLAFLDVMPLSEGHTLVIPKKEIDLIFNLDTEEFKSLWGFAQQIAKKIEKNIPCERVSIAVVGLEIPHAHIHLVPINRIEDLDFKKDRIKFSVEDFKEIQQKILK